MITIEKLKAYGANTEEGLSRCVGNEAFYLKMVNRILDDNGFDRLKDAVEAGDMKASFEAAHALKGVLGNLSLTPAYEVASEMTELLRAGTEMDYHPLLEKVLAQKEILEKMKED